MSDKKMMFLAVNMLITVLSLAIIIGTMFIENQKIKLVAIAVAISILVTQKIVEIIVIKETRKVSIVVLFIIVAAAGYFGYKMFLEKGELMLFTLAPNFKKYSFRRMLLST